MHSTCRVCRGQVRPEAWQGFCAVRGWVLTSCVRGQGKVIDRPCTTCKGEGRVGSTKTTGEQDSHSIRLGVDGKGQVESLLDGKDGK
eukprot:2854568-Rhodomonas_salina.2